MWVNTEPGPTCKCGWPTAVSVSKGRLPILWCFGHTKEAGAMWPLPNDKPGNWPNLSDEEMQALIVKGEAQHKEKEKMSTAIATSSHVHAGRWGFHPCDKETFLKLKELNKLYQQALHQMAAFRRWEGKEPRNRFGRERIRDANGRVVDYGPKVLVEAPALNHLIDKETYHSDTNRSGHWLGAGKTEEREKVSFRYLADLIGQEYKYARTPQPAASGVRQLKLTLADIERLLID